MGSRVVDQPLEDLYDEILDARREIEVLDEGYVYRALGRINLIADHTASTLPAELRKPLLAIMAYAQEAQRRLIDG